MSRPQSKINTVIRLFKKWILFSLSLKYLSIVSKVNLVTLDQKFQHFLSHYPRPGDHFFLARTKLNFSGILLVDADWFGQDYCLIVYRDQGNKMPIFWRYSTGEYKEELLLDICFLVDNGYPLRGIVSDSKTAIVFTVKQVGINRKMTIPHQRCLVHVQLHCQGLLTQRPKTEAGRSLLSLVYSLNQVTNNYEKQILTTWLKRWQQRYLEIINHRTIVDFEGKKTWWYTHKNLRRVFRTLWLNWDYLFTYLNYTFLPKDNNGTEGFFSQFDSRLNRHRGLKQSNRLGFISWLFYFRLQDTKPTRT